MWKTTEYEILFPNGNISKLDCCEHTTTLNSLKEDVWTKFGECLYASMKTKEEYLFVGILYDGYTEEFWNEDRLLAGLNLGVKTLRLEEKKSCDVSIKLIDEEIGVCTSMSTVKLKEISKSIPEILDFRYSMLTFLREDALSLCQDDMSVFSYTYSAPKVSVLNNLTLKILDYKEFISIKVSLVLDSDSSLRENILFKRRGSWKQSFISVPTQSCISDVWNAIREDFGFDNAFELINSCVLRVCCTQVFLLDLKEKLVSYHYIQICLFSNVTPVLQVESMEELCHADEVPETSLFCLHYENLLSHYCKSHRNRSRKNEKTKSNKNLNGPIQLKILDIKFNDAKHRSDAKMFLKAALYFGVTLISDIWEVDLFLDKQELNCQHQFNIAAENIPVGSKLCLSLCQRLPKGKSIIGIPIGWVNVKIFNTKGIILNGTVCLPFLNILDTHDVSTLLHPEGESYDYSFISTIQSERFISLEIDSHLSVTVRPTTTDSSALSNENNFSIKKNPETVNDSKLILERIKQISEDCLNDHIFEQDKHFIWSHRNLCRKHPISLYALMEAVNWTEREDVMELYKLIESWPCLPSEVSLKILSSKFPDPKAIEFSMECLGNTLLDIDICNYMLPLVQSTTLLPLENSMTKLLLKRAMRNIDIALQLFWHLKSHFSNEIQTIRFSLIQDVLCRSCHPLFKIVSRQTQAINYLSYISGKISDGKSRLNEFKMYLECPKLKDALENIVSPVNRMHKLENLLKNHCSVKCSKNSPLFISWEVGSNAVVSHHRINHLLWKVGNDLRQDVLIIGVLKTVDKIWKESGYNFNVVIYACLTTHSDKGIIEIVSGAKTLLEIQQLKFTGAIQINKSALYDWLSEKNKGHALYQALDIFTKSCVAFTVFAFVMGIRDRHNDNIMVTSYGQIFHIDFGHILNNCKRKFGVLRERTPFVLTQDIVYAISRGKSDYLSSDYFNNFIQLCKKAYLIIRKSHHLLVSLLRLMIDCRLPELHSDRDIQYIRYSLALDKTDDEALEFFERQIFESIKHEWTTRADWFAHWVKKGKFLGKSA